MGFDVNGIEMPSGGRIPMSERIAYRTYTDKSGRTNAGVLVANYPVTSEITKKVFPPHNGYVIANHKVVYWLNEVPVLTRSCQISVTPDKSEASIAITERTFVQDIGMGGENRSITITREQFDLLAELWGINTKPEGSE